MILKFVILEVGVLANVYTTHMVSEAQMDSFGQGNDATSKQGRKQNAFFVSAKKILNNWWYVTTGSNCVVCICIANALFMRCYMHSDLDARPIAAMLSVTKSIVDGTAPSLVGSISSEKQQFKAVVTAGYGQRSRTIFASSSFDDGLKLLLL